ncbi:MAG: peptide deformylase [Candidatus Latescibacteria bacterium]|nr:peptide deformylase [Candidatus Latescibacterota bacterium]
MAILKVSRMGHPVLRQPAKALTSDQILQPAIQQLIGDMVETMVDYEGVGLAAPQVYQSLRLLVLGYPDADPEDPDDLPLTAFINPEWVTQSEEKELGYEGCLSIPDLRGQVPRSAWVEVRALDREGKPFALRAEGFLARVLQHEVDHLDGILFPDRMENFSTLSFLEEYYRYWHKKED